MKTEASKFDLIAHLDWAIKTALTTAPTTAQSTPIEFVASMIALALSMATAFKVVHLDILVSFLPQSEPDVEKTIAAVRSVYASRRTIDAGESD